MLHAAAMLIGLFALGLLAFQRGLSPEALMLAAGVAVICVVFAARFGGLARTPFSAPQIVLLALSRSGAVLGGALTTIRAAIAADVTLNPALVRVRTRASDPFSRAVLADVLGAAPGILVVEADADGALAHVTNEEAVDAADIGALEARVLAVLGDRA